MPFDCTGAEEPRPVRIYDCAAIVRQRAIELRPERPTTEDLLALFLRVRHDLGEPEGRLSVIDPRSGRVLHGAIVDFDHVAVLDDPWLC